jgi:dethiobiotin synthetase
VSEGWYLTGSDTGVGKTYVACALVRALAADGRAVRAMKPVASGSRETPGGLRNEDAEALLAAMPAPKPAYDDVNPFALREPIAPHLAARHDGVAIDLAKISALHRRLLREAGDGASFVVEGVGGWEVPLDDDEMQPELARALGHPVLLVVGLKLGCINHALLTARSIRDERCTFGGWVANHVEPGMPYADEVIATIAKSLGSPAAVLAHGGELGRDTLTALRHTVAEP